MAPTNVPLFLNVESLTFCLLLALFRLIGSKRRAWHPQLVLDALVVRHMEEGVGLLSPPETVCLRRSGGAMREFTHVSLSGGISINNLKMSSLPDAILQNWMHTIRKVKLLSGMGDA